MANYNINTLTWIIQFGGWETDGFGPVPADIHARGQGQQGQVMPYNMDTITGRELFFLQVCTISKNIYGSFSTHIFGREKVHFWLFSDLKKAGKKSSDGQ